MGLEKKDKLNVLFVDDEEMILKGMRRLLHRHRSSWGMHFANSGAEALELMQTTPIDVIVSDMRMPQMNGNELLAEVKKRYPSVVRIILSGHADVDMTLIATRYAHRYLSKPCDGEELQAAVEDCCRLRDWVNSDTLRGLVSGMSVVPSLPSLYTEIVDALEDEDMGLREVGEIISRDAGMTAKILQLVNSAFFGLAQNMDSIPDAVAYLGSGTITPLVLSTQIFSQFKDSDVDVLNIEKITHHNLQCGAFARQIATSAKAPQDIRNQALLAGNLHDLGQLVIASNMPQEYEHVQVLVQEKGLSRCEAELKVIGSTHSQVGAYLLHLWGLPQPIVEAVAFHHNPGASLDKEFTPLTAVHIANAIHCAAELDPGGPLNLDLDYLARIGVDKRIEEWRDQCVGTLSGGGHE